MTVGKPEPKQLLRPITIGTNSAMNQSQFLAITCNSFEAREKSRVHGAVGFGFASHWLKNWREPFKPITKRSNRNHVITFDSHLKIALSTCLIPNSCFSLHNWCCATVSLQTKLFIIWFIDVSELKQPRRQRKRKPHKFAICICLDDLSIWWQMFNFDF